MPNNTLYLTYTVLTTRAEDASLPLNLSSEKATMMVYFMLVHGVNLTFFPSTIPLHQPTTNSAQNLRLRLSYQPSLNTSPSRTYIFMTHLNFNTARFYIGICLVVNWRSDVLRSIVKAKLFTSFAWKLHPRSHSSRVSSEVWGLLLLLRLLLSKTNTRWNDGIFRWAPRTCINPKRRRWRSRIYNKWIY